MDLEKLVEEFAFHVAAQTDIMAGDDGDVRIGNRHARRYVAAFEKLRAQGGAGRDALARLLTHPRVDVRAMAAAFLLRHRTAEARAVLEEVAKGGGLSGWSASETLRGWDERTWELDPEGDGPPPPPNPRKKRPKPG